jgi:hypothetical protein
MDKGDEPRPVLTTNKKPRSDFGLSGAFLIPGAICVDQMRDVDRRCDQPSQDNVVYLVIVTATVVLMAG